MDTSGMSESNGKCGREGMTGKKRRGRKNDARDEKSRRKG